MRQLPLYSKPVSRSEPDWPLKGRSSGKKIGEMLSSHIRLFPLPAAKAKGVYKGRPVTLDHPRILAMRADGKGATEIAMALGCSRGAVYKVLNGTAGT